MYLLKMYASPRSHTAHFHSFFAACGTSLRLEVLSESAFFRLYELERFYVRFYPERVTEQTGRSVRASA